MKINMPSWDNPRVRQVLAFAGLGASLLLREPIGGMLLTMVGAAYGPSFTQKSLSKAAPLRRLFSSQQAQTVIPARDGQVRDGQVQAHATPVWQRPTTADASRYGGDVLQASLDRGGPPPPTWQSPKTTRSTGLDNPARAALARSAGSNGMADGAQEGRSASRPATGRQGSTRG